MAHYSTQEFLSHQARMSQMELRGRKPPPPPGYIHPPEHERQEMQAILNSIPETPAGPNAFATQAAEAEKARIEGSASVMEQRRQRKASGDARVQQMSEVKKDRRVKEASSKKQLTGLGVEAPQMLDQNDDHYLNDVSLKHVTMKSQLATNPRYQAALARAQAAPPTDIHPAFRQRSNSEISVASPPRQSDITSFGDFMKAGAQPSPKLKLMGTPNPNSVPTLRGRFEERAEQAKHEQSGSQEERIPVFHPTPKMSAGKDFAQRPGTPSNALDEAIGSKHPAKTPKKSLFSKLKLSANSRTNSAPAGEMPTDPASFIEVSVPMKAAAVLGESPRKHKGRLSLGSSPTKLPRSPSKRKGLFSRKDADVAKLARPSTSLADYQRPPNTPSTVISDGTQTLMSASAHTSYQSSQGRHIAFKGDLEDTSEKQKQLQKSPMTRSQSVRLGCFDGVIPPTPPAKNTPPHEKSAKEAKELDEMQEAMKLPAQHDRSVEFDDGFLSARDRTTKYGSNGYREAPRLVTMPSMASMHASVVPDLMEASTVEEMNARVGALDLEGFSIPTERIRRSNIAEAVYSPSVYGDEWTGNAACTSPGATPLLTISEARASDNLSAHTKESSSNGTIPIIYPELASDPSFKKPSNEVNTEANTTPTRGHGRSRSHLSPELTWHNRTHSRDHFDTDQQSLFAHHVDNQENRHAIHDTPTSFSHASAIVSPLHYLPATVYSPPGKKRKGKGKVVDFKADVQIVDAPSDDRSRVEAANDGSDAQLGSLTIQGSDETTTATAHSLSHKLTSISTDKFDLIMAALGSRNDAITEMQQELRATRARLDQRLSLVESVQRATPPQTPTDTQTGQAGDAGTDDPFRRSQANRIPTDVAHEFYRSAMPREPEQLINLGDEAGGRETRGGETIRVLQNQNAALMQLVMGLSGKMEELEQRLERRST